jgi:tetratricopeptide (TPR) repeat protein
LSVYAAFEITASMLDPRALRLLGILSFYHFTGFPLPLFELAVKAQFSTVPFDLLDRDKQEFDNTVQFLKDVLCPDGQWQEAELRYLIDELQAHSLVSLVPVYAITTLRFHPLTLLWAHDRLLSDGNLMEVHRAAAIRLLVCGTTLEHLWLAEYLLPHVEVICKSIEHVHVNDRAGFASLMDNCNEKEALFRITQEMYRIVEAAHGKKHIGTIIAGRWRAIGYWRHGDYEMGETLFREVLAIAEEVLGEENMETAQLKTLFSFFLQGDEVKELRTSALRAAIKCCGLGHRRTSQYMENLAVTFNYRREYSEARYLFEGAIAILTKLFGRSHPSTVDVLDQLACFHQSWSFHDSPKDMEKAMELHEEILEYKKKNNGGQHPPRSLPSIQWLQSTYSRLGRFAEWEVMLRHELEIRRNNGQDTHATLGILSGLGATCFDQKRYEEAWQLWKEGLEIRSRIGALSSRNITYIYDMYDRDERYADAKKFLEEALEMQLRSTRHHDDDLELTRSYLTDLEQKLEKLAHSAATSKGNSSDTVSAQEAQVRPTGLQIVDNPPATPQSATPQITPPLPDNADPTVSAASASTSTRSVVYSRAEVVLVPLLFAAAAVFLPTINP